MSEINLGNQISKYYQSFSGTDTLAFIMIPGCTPVLIGSLTTISYSMYRNKKPVINIGRTNINGVTRGSRIFAGTMVFTLINQHWLKELQQQGTTWLSDYGYTKHNGEWVPDDSYELRVDELPLFDIMIVSANEYGNYVSMYIYGIDFTDEAQTISVEDLFTENVFSFVARDISNFKSGNIRAKHVHKAKSSKRNVFSQHFYVLDSSFIGLDELAKLEQEFRKAKIQQTKEKTKIFTLVRNLYYSSAQMMIGNDVANIQEMLNQTKQFNIPISGMFDTITDEAVRKYQSLIGDNVDGIVDEKLYNALINQVAEAKVKLGVVVNRFGAFVHKEASLNADIVDTKQFREQVPIHEVIASEVDGYFQRWYRINTGYIVEEDLYSSYYTGSVIEFPKLEYKDKNAYVTLVQSALANIYPSYSNITGLYDYETQEKIKELQAENNLLPTGIVDNETWIVLQTLTGDIKNKVSNDNYIIDMATPPGRYMVNQENLDSIASSFNAIVSCDNDILVKVTAICIYDDNSSETYTKNMTIKEAEMITLETFPNIFNYNPQYGKEPTQIDFIIYPYNKKPYKWTIMYS